VSLDLEIGVAHLQKLFIVDNQKMELPVAFATNAMYVLAKNGLARTPES
jgi:hypothetical protein